MNVSTAGARRSGLLTNLSLFTSLSTLLCCALPSLLVLIGLGATVASVRGNTASVSTNAVSATGRYVRLSVIAGEQAGDGAARIYELEVYG